MSDRYVWERYNFTADLQQAEQTSSVWVQASTGDAYIYTTKDIGNLSLPSSVTSWPANPQMNNYEERLWINSGMDDTISNGNYFALAGNNRGPDSTYGVYYTSRNISAKVMSTSASQVRVQFGVPYPYKMVYQPIKGSSAGEISNASSSTYPPRNYSLKSARIWP